MSVVDDHEPVGRKGTRREGERWKDHTFKVCGVAAVVCTTLSATNTLSTSHQEKAAVSKVAHGHARIKSCLCWSDLFCDLLL